MNEQNDSKTLGQLLKDYSVKDKVEGMSSPSLITNEQNETETPLQLLKDYNEPPIIKDQVDKPMNKNQNSLDIIDKLSCEIGSLRIVDVPSSTFLLKDLVNMVLERLDVDTIKYAARVQRSWRSYIAINQKRMRFLPVKNIMLSIPYWYPIRIQEISEPFGCSSRKLELVLNQQTSITLKCPITFSYLLGYKPTEYLILLSNGVCNSRSSLFQLQMNDLYALPDWWLNQIKKVECYINGQEGDYSSSFIQRFKHLHVLCVNVSLYIEEEYLKEFVKRIPRVDTLIISTGLYNDGMSEIFVDSILEVIIKRSWIYPAEFPVFHGKSSFTLACVIRFIEKTKFSPVQEVHRIYIFSPVVGNTLDWIDWLNDKTTTHQFTVITNDKTYYTLDGYDHFVNNENPLQWKFTFREEKFDVIIRSFIAFKS